MKKKIKLKIDIKVKNQKSLEKLYWKTKSKSK